MKKDLIKYFKSLGIEVYTNTKARGHQGIFLNNRIDISKNTKEERIIPTLLHEFAHYIHNKIEPGMIKTGGTLEVLFNIENRGCEKFSQNTLFPIFSAQQCQVNADLSVIQKELLLVTNFVDKHSQMTKLNEHREQVKRKIKLLEAEIKKDYPNFMRSKKFKEFDKYIKKSKAKYLLKFDRVKFISPRLLGFLNRAEIFSIECIEKDFPEMPQAFAAYIRLKSNTRKQARISARINKLNKYYAKPTELFARFVEGIYLDEAQTLAFAPYTTQRFFELIKDGYYLELKNVLEMLQREKSLI